MASINYLLDTNILSEIVNPEPSLPVIQRFSLHRQSICISTITWHEMNYGVMLMNPGRRKRSLQRYLNEVIEAYIPMYAYDKKAALWHAEQRQKLRQQGLEPSYADGQIAAIAATHDFILVTRNTKDFIHFEDVQLENWFDDLPDSKNSG